MLNENYKKLLIDKASNTDALTRYIDFIETILKQNRIKMPKESVEYVYYEKHHILPKSLFPELINKKDNWVLLTAREHFIAHKLLLELTTCKEMVYALWRMACCNKDIADVTPEEYEQARLFYINQEHWNKGLHVPEDVKTKISNTLKQRYKEIPYIMSKEHHEKSVQTRKTNGNYCRTSDQNERTSNTLKGRIFINNGEKNKRIYPEELSNYIDAGWLKGKKPLSEEHKKNIGLSSKGHIAWNNGKEGTFKGRRHSEEAKKKISKAKSKKVLCVETGYVYNSVTGAIKDTKITSISMCCRGKIKTAGGYHWEYV